MIGKTNAVNVGNIVSPTVEMVNISLLTNQLAHDDLLGARVTVSYGERTEILDWIGSPITIGIPVDASYLISVSDVTGYKTPQQFSATAIGGNARTVTLVYKTEKVTVDVSANDGASVEGQVVTVAKPIPNGVYIQDIKGNLYKESDWDDSKAANGIAVVTDECQFVMALSDALSSNAYWGVYETKVTGIATTTDQGAALADYAGDTNTNQIINQLQGKYINGVIGAPAAEAARAFIFPNGKVGYLPALGEWNIAYANKAAISSALSKCGGTALIEDYYWSSTQYDDKYSWRMGWNDGSPSRTHKSFGVLGKHAVRAFTTLERIINETYEVTDSPITFKAAHGTEYSVSVNDKEGYQTPATKSFTAQMTVNNVVMEYIKSASKRTVVRIDQTISDPSTMITRIVDEGGIEAIRANSHRYVGALNFLSGIMEIRQLQDADGTKFLDGTTAPLTTLGADVWMRLPQFYWKCVQHSADVWDFYVAYGIKPDDTYNTWDGKDLIGVYEAYAVDSKLYSYSGVTPATSSTHPVLKGYAVNRGVGFSTVKWKHHCMMAMLFYSQYGNTNSQSIVGSGTSTSTKATGSTNTFGMTDTVAGVNGDNMSINFWGLENWWGNSWEWVDNVSCIMNGTTETWTITEDDGSQRVINPTPISNYASKLMFGENIDLANASSTPGSATTGYCDYSYIISTSSTRYVLRSGWSNNTLGGVSFIYSGPPSSLTAATVTSRLAYRGDYVIIE